MTYSKEAMDKALELCRRGDPGLTEIHATPRDVATYIQQVSDAAKEADEVLKKEGYFERGGTRAELRQLILSDSVNPLLREAREIVAKLNENQYPKWAKLARAGIQDDHPEVQAALEALKSREAK